MSAPVSDDDVLAAWRAYHEEKESPWPDPKPGDWMDQAICAGLRRALINDRRRVAERSGASA